jgi:DNA-binding FadR family transcriptional regulator
MGELGAQGLPFEEEDRQFHTLISRSIDSRTYQRLLDVFWLAYRHASQHIASDADPGRTWLEHRTILDALEARDVPRARRALEEHYSGLKTRLATARLQSASR